MVSSHLCAGSACISRKGGAGEVGWGHPQGDMHMVAAVAGCRNVRVVVKQMGLKMLLSPCKG